MKKKITCVLFMCLIGLLNANLSCADLLKLNESENGSEVEILEEHEDSFVIKIPKEEIKVIKRKRPTEAKLWKQKRILWEDTEDYLMIYLPKERIVLPEDYTGNEYDSASALGKQLTLTGAEGRPEGITFMRGTGRVVGKILKGGQPFKGAKIKIVSINSQTNKILSILGGKNKRDQEVILETTTDEFGQFVFSDIPLGDYDIYWSVSGEDGWYRRLSEKPDITVTPGAIVSYPDIELK
ncbi:MAG: carboxypeptidase-like regulatory domain-containing protein [Candidatus Scalindua sp.]